MFDALPSPVAVTLTVAASTREGWHPRPLSTLQGLVTIDAESLTADEALSAMVSLQRERAALDALEARLLVRAAGATRVVRDVLVDEGTGDGSLRQRTVQMMDEVVDEIAAVLHRTHGSVQADLARARLLNGPLRRTRESLAAGRITAEHCRAIADQAARMAASPLGHDRAADAAFAESCATLQDRVLDRAQRETAADTRQRARRAIASIDAAGARARRRRARCTRDVQAWGEDDGMGVVMARLTATDAAWVAAAVESHARAHADDDTLGIDPDAAWGEVRAAAFLDLLRRRGAPDGSISPVGPSIEVQVVIDLSTLVGSTPDLPASLIVGSSSRAEADRDDVMDLLADVSTPVTLRRLVCDPLTGALVDRSARRYSASTELVAWLLARDQTCRHPGCTRRAATGDVDHAQPFGEGGLTAVSNTGILCRRHHNRKTHSGWRIENSRADGSCSIVSPTGRRFHHDAVNLSPGSIVPAAGSPPPGPPSTTGPPIDDPPF